MWNPVDFKLCCCSLHVHPLHLPSANKQAGGNSHGMEHPGKSDEQDLIAQVNNWMNSFGYQITEVTYMSSPFLKILVKGFITFKGFFLLILTFIWAINQGYPNLLESQHSQTHLCQGQFKAWEPCAPYVKP